MTRPIAILTWGAVLALVLPACAQQGSLGPLPSISSPPSCDAAPAQAAVGQAASAALAESARAQAGAATVRQIGYGQMITREYFVGRLNLQLDAAGKVARVYCG